MADVGVSLGIDAQELYQELQNVTAKFVQFSQQTTQAGHQAGGGFLSGVQSGFSKIGGVLSGVGNSIKNVFSSVLGGLGIGLSIAGVEQLIEKTVSAGAHIEDLSRRYGVSAAVLSRWGFAAEKAGTDIDTVGKALGFLEKNREKAAHGDEKQIAHFKSLGVSLEQIRNPLVRTDDLLGLVGKSSLNAADFLAVFGKGALAVRPLVAGVADGLIVLNRGLSNADAKKLKEIEDHFITLKQSITLQVGPAIVAVFDSLSTHLEIFIKNVEIAGVQLTALHTAAKTSNPKDFTAALHEGLVQTRQIEGEFAKKQNLKLDPYAKEIAEIAPSGPRPRDFGTLAGSDADGDEDEEDKGGKGKGRGKGKRKRAEDESEIARIRELSRPKTRFDEAEKLSEHHARERERNEKAATREAEKAQREGAHTAHLTPSAPLSPLEEARKRDEEDRRAHGSYTGPGGGIHSGLVTGHVQGSGGLKTGSLSDALSDQDFHKQFQRRDLVPGDGGADDFHKQFQRRGISRADEVKAAGLGKDSDKEKHLPVAEKQLTALEKIEKNTADMGKNK